MFVKSWKSLGLGYGLGVAMIVSVSLLFGVGIIILSYIIRNGISKQSIKNVDMWGEIKALLLGSVIVLVVVSLISMIVGFVVFGFFSALHP